MNAGTAQKITLNTLSTTVMVKLGKTYGNLMVDLRATNTKLRDPAVRIVQSITGVGPQAAAQALEAAGWDAKLACLMAASGQDLATVSSALGTAGGRLRQALALVRSGYRHGAPAGGVPAGWWPAGGGGPPGVQWWHRGARSSGTCWSTVGLSLPTELDRDRALHFDPHEKRESSSHKTNGGR